jgi:hypothetical protein
MKNLTNWARLAAAAIDARNDLRMLLPRLDSAIASTPTPLLLELRALAIRHADSLRRALKHPAARLHSTPDNSR